jgi:hypothetical protein
MTLARCQSRDSGQFLSLSPLITAILSETFEPPRITRNDRSEFASSSFRYRGSRSIMIRTFPSTSSIDIEVNAHEDSSSFHFQIAD